MRDEMSQTSNPTVEVAERIVRLVGLPGILALAWMAMIGVLGFFFHGDATAVRESLPYVFGAGVVLVVVALIARAFAYFDERLLAKRITELERRVDELVARPGSVPPAAIFPPPPPFKEE